MTIRTEILIRFRLVRRKDYATLAMPVIMVFPLFRKEFEGEEKFSPVLPSDGPDHLLIIQLTIESIGLPAETVGRMGIGIGKEGDLIKSRKSPVHCRDGGK